jgi:hypothetical protein
MSLEQLVKQQHFFYNYYHRISDLVTSYHHHHHHHQHHHLKISYTAFSFIIKKFQKHYNILIDFAIRRV